jgi:hypothetical protein
VESRAEGREGLKGRREKSRREKMGSGMRWANQRSGREKVWSGTRRTNQRRGIAHVFGGGAPEPRWQWFVRSGAKV